MVEQEVVATALTPQNLTTMGALVTAIGSLWGYILKLQADHRRMIKEKDQELKQANEQNANLLREVVKVTEQVKSTVENNTQAMRDNGTLTQKVYDALVRKE